MRKAKASSDSLAIRVQAEQIASQWPVQPGHPSTLTDPDKVSLLLASIADGNYRETACRAAGIPKQTLYNWLKLAEQGNEAAKTFSDALEKAEAQAEQEMVGCVRQAAKAGPQFWAAGMTFLERKAPDRWGKRQDDSSAPKVVVQIGIRDSDITVNTSLSPVPQTEIDGFSTG